MYDKEIGDVNLLEYSTSVHGTSIELTCENETIDLYGINEIKELRDFLTEIIEKEGK